MTFQVDAPSFQIIATVSRELPNGLRIYATQRMFAFNIIAGSKIFGWRTRLFSLSFV